MTEIARPLIKELTDRLWPLLKNESDREAWLDVALADLSALRGEIDWSGSPHRFTRRLVSELLTRQGSRGQQGLLNLLDDIADQKGVDWQQAIQPLRDRVAAFAPGAEPAVTPPPAILLELCDQLQGQHAPAELDLDEATVQAILRHRPQDLTTYRVARIAEWSQPRYALDKRFVQLALLLDRGEDAQGARFVEQANREFQDLGEVLAAVPDPALVLLGAPGAGKSTLLRRYELDTARAVLAKASNSADTETPLTFFIPLNTYRAEHPEPLPPPRAWLNERWAERYPGLPPLENLLQAGRMTLLLDALNEIPQAGDEPVRRWKEFLAELHQQHPGNRVIFSCRSLDYSASLSSTALPVPQVRIKALSDDRVQQFLHLYCPRYADTLWNNLQNTPQLELLRTPFYLKLLIEMTREGEVPEGRAALFTGFVRRALVREVRADHPLFRPNDLLKARDCQRLEQARRWKHPYDLPTRGILIDKLSNLAHAMQERYSARTTANNPSTQPEHTLKTGEASQIRIDLDDALDILDHPRDEDILKAGEAIGVLDEDLDTDEVLYRHQLMQEYFAARLLAEQPEPNRVRVAWEVGKTSPSLTEILAKLADADPLPPLPATGWEETTVLAAAMTADADTFISKLMAVNLPLAGRCAAQPDVTVSAKLKTELQQALIARTQNPQADLRARITAGLALGMLGDPRFERRAGPDGDYLLPPLVEIPGGDYTLGSDEGYFDNEKPVHTVTLAPFQMGQFPVTNAEWALFMQAGGYEDERWWVTEEDKAWRRGDLGAEGTKQTYREFRKARQQDFESWRASRSDLTSTQIEGVQALIDMTDDEFEDWLDEWLPAGRQTQPSVWNDDAFNNPAQPVVGITWYEARAYCAWLSAQTGQPFRLPTEAEWEAAARGQAGRRFAYDDDFDAARCNTFESHIRRTTPVGVFPGGETPDTGLVDMAGNVWEWTSSLYASYPYVSSDGRENPITGDGPRVVRGGSWGNFSGGARATYRYNGNPVVRDGGQGFRVVCSSPIS